MKLIKIQSSIAITVTENLEYIDYTKKDSDIPNRLKVSPTWFKKVVDINQGVGYYPEEVKDWSSVKALVEANIFTLGEIVDENKASEDSLNVRKIEHTNFEVDNAKPKKRLKLEE